MEGGVEELPTKPQSRAPKRSGSGRRSREWGSWAEKNGLEAARGRLEEGVASFKFFFNKSPLTVNVLCDGSVYVLCDVHSGQHVTCLQHCSSTRLHLVCTHKIFTVFSFISHVYHLDLHFFILLLSKIRYSRFI
jgi:hypothetical protein